MSEPPRFPTVEEADAALQRARATFPAPVAPRNRVLREGELPCFYCGSGRDDHAQRDHRYITRPLRRNNGGPPRCLWCGSNRKCQCVQPESLWQRLMTRLRQARS